ncbi:MULTISPECIES: baseplate J/gp47 family protein [unclassified Microcoleus]|uniref:baseplate J/gp47 family protein n=1 Tax=unclassified Microcoleus TaxID=2642155 RepID=UPI002FD12DF9
MNDSPICPCEGFTHPAVLFNPPGRDAIAYRAGTYLTFRRSLLQSLPHETELTQWRPGAKRDLALQLVEWWAYLADILTFYNERIANESYLKTADLPESVQGLIQILGYRPRPGIGARGVVAALTNHPTLFTLPQGFQIQSKPGPGKQPQIFELDVDRSIEPLDAVTAVPLANPKLLVGASVLLQGKVTTVKAGDRLLLIEKGWNGSGNYALVVVQQVQPEKDPAGNTNTRVTFTSTPTLGNAEARQFRLLKSDRSAHVWQHPANPGVVIQENQVHLEAIARQIKAGDPILFEIPSQPRFTAVTAMPIVSAVNLLVEDTSLRRTLSIGTGVTRKRSTELPTPAAQLVSVSEYTEVIWYANGDRANPALTPTPPLPANVPLIPIPHTQLSFTRALSGNWDAQKTQVIVHYDWQDVGQLIETPATAFHSADPRIVTASAIAFPTDSSTLPIQLEDANNQGIAANATAGSSPSLLQLSNLAETNLELKSPLRVLLNLLPVSRGQTITNEVLGSGNASLAGQEFSLNKSPLTYLLDPESSSGKDYKSTLRLWVNDIEWREVPSFYGQAADARIFVTREDVDQKTHVLFGDGVNGSRLPTGSNVVATYRYGSGAAAPEPGTLNVIVKPYPNLKAIRNPVAVGGGADPDPPQQIRRYAPRSVLTFDRAVSADDYETIAAQAPGVARSRAYWTWDAGEGRSLVVIYVGDDISAVTAATTALRNAADPNRPVLIKQAIAIPIRLNLSLKIEPSYAPKPVVAAVRTALLDADTGLFGTNAVRIGQSIYQSQICAACLQVSGVMAVHGLMFLKGSDSGFVLDTSYRHDPGEGKFYQLSTDRDLQVTAEVPG